MIYYHNVVRIW